MSRTNPGFSAGLARLGHDSARFTMSNESHNGSNFCQGAAMKWLQEMSRKTLLSCRKYHKDIMLIMTVLMLVIATAGLLVG